MEISITNQQEALPILAEIEAVFYELGEIVAQEFSLPEDAVVDLTLVDDSQMRRLNVQYRAIDDTTDVLSFAMQDSTEEELPFPETEDHLLGDVIISVPRAMLQSVEYGHSLARELGFLFVHGLLHLLGYDHQEAREESEMFAIQEKILQRAGVKRN